MNLVWGPKWKLVVTRKAQRQRWSMLCLKCYWDERWIFKCNWFPLLLKFLSIQAGMLGHNKFLSGDRCKMYNHFLPNSVDFVQNYHNKAFCGTYSKEGHYFLSACQGWYCDDFLIILWPKKLLYLQIGSYGSTTLARVNSNFSKPSRLVTSVGVFWTLLSVQTDTMSFTQVGQSAVSITQHTSAFETK